MVVGRRKCRDTRRVAGPGDRAAGLAVGSLVRGVGLVRAVLAAVLGALVRPDRRVVAAHPAQRLEVALGQQPGERGIEAAVARLEDAPLLGHEGIEVVGRDQLVLGPVDELDEAAERPVRAEVVDEREVRRDVAQQEHLPDAIEHVGPRRQPGIGRVLGQDPMAEAVEVRDGHPGARRRAHRLVQSILELARGLHVVGQDQQVLRQQPVAVLEQPLDPLDDDPRLAGPGARDDHHRPIAPLDDPALVGRGGNHGGEKQIVFWARGSCGSVASSSRIAICS